MVGPNDNLGLMRTMDRQINLVWGTQMTTDISARCTYEERKEFLELVRKLALGELDRVSRNGCVGKKDLEDFISRADAGLNGHQGDLEIKGSTKRLFARIATAFKDHFPEAIYALGGSPAISALAGIYLKNGTHVFYLGNLPEGAFNIIRDFHGQALNGFAYGSKTDHRPGTFSIERLDGLDKYMLPFSEGRELKDLDMSIFFERLHQIYQKGPTVFALGGLNKGKPEEYQELVERIRKENPEMKLFVTTNSFKSPKEAAEYHDRVIRNVHGVSYNDVELDKTHAGLDGRPNAPLIEKLQYVADREGPMMTVVHHAEGAVAMGPEGMSIALENAVEGATLRYLTGRYHNQTEIGRSKMRLNHSPARFEEVIGSPVDRLPPGIVYAAAPSLSGLTPDGSITGAGATFDGIYLCDAAHLLWR
jgi:hypothetical protein